MHCQNLAETGFLLRLESGPELSQFGPADPHRLSWVLPLPIPSRQICYEIFTFILAHLMAMNLNGTQIPADGVRTTTSSIHGVCIGSNVRERKKERGEKEWYDSPCLSSRSRVQALVSSTPCPARRARLALLERTTGDVMTPGRFSQTSSTATIDRHSASSTRAQGARLPSVRLPPGGVDRRPAREFVPLVHHPSDSRRCPRRCLRCQVRSSCLRTSRAMSELAKRAFEAGCSRAVIGSTPLSCTLH